MNSSPENGEAGRYGLTRREFSMLFGGGIAGILAGGAVAIAVLFDEERYFDFKDGWDSLGFNFDDFLYEHGLRGAEDVIAPDYYEITGPYPVGVFNFSAEVLSTGLVPSVFRREDSVSLRAQKAVKYIERLRDALRKFPHLLGPTLWSLEINTPSNLAVPFGPEANLLTVLDSFLSDVESSRVQFDPTPSTHRLNFGVDNLPILTEKEGKWVWTLRSKILTGEVVMNQNYSLESSNYYVSDYSDVQWAIKFLHEYMHCKQDEPALDYINSTSSVSTSNTSSIDETKAAIQRFNLEQTIRLWQQYEGISEISGKPFNARDVAFNEAQANSISQLAVHQLTVLNQGQRFPGLINDDPYPGYEGSLYRTFKREVLADSRAGVRTRALNPRWLVLHMNWGK